MAKTSEVERDGDHEVEGTCIERKAIGEDFRQKTTDASLSGVFEGAKGAPERIVRLAASLVLGRSANRTERGRADETPAARMVGAGRQRQPTARASSAASDPPHAFQASLAKRGLGIRRAGNARPREQQIGADPSNREKESVCATRGDAFGRFHQAKLEAVSGQRNEKSAMKKFVLGAIVGAFLVYAYFEYYGGAVGPPDWVGNAASNYRGDRTHDGAREALR